MITKAIVKDYAAKKCEYLTSLELDNNSLIKLLKKAIDSKEKIIEDLAEDIEESYGDELDNSFFDINDLLYEYPDLNLVIKDYEKSINKNAVEILIEKYNDNELVSKLSRTYFEMKYGKDVCARCDIDEDNNPIYEQAKIIENTNKYLDDDKIKVIFEGQVEYDNLRARFDVLIKNDDGTYQLIEVKGTNDVFKHPEKTKELDNKIKRDYLYDLLFQYYLYSKKGCKFSSIAYMFTNSKFELNDLTFPVSNNDLDELFIIKDKINLKSGSESLIDYFDRGNYIEFDKTNKVFIVKSIETIIKEINDIAKMSLLIPKKCYLCRKGPRCPFINLCFKDAEDANSIFKLTNWNLYGGNYLKTIDLIEQGIEKISDIPNFTFAEYKKHGDYSNIFSQIRYAKGEIKEKYIISLKKIKKILLQDYFNDEVKHLIFFDFESFQYPIPLVEKSRPWYQVVSQYSMHIVSKDYDLSKHDFKNGTGGGITHYEYIGNPDADKFNNPSIELYKTLLKQLKEAHVDYLSNNYKVVVFNKNFEKTRMKDFIERFSGEVNSELINMVSKFNENVVDLLDFFTSGSIYCKDFNGRGSLKIVQPTLTEDKDVIDFYNNKHLLFDFSDSLDYHKNDTCLVYNGSICLDLYKSLLIRSHLDETDIGPSTKSLLAEALAYCKIDSWGTVVIYDIIKNIADGNLKIDAKYR